ncbi:hypothetical protein [Microvirga zambiensis]|uniref:hypothetical protein n=1 Tax=Microvirga zambiensis TaxID=1402137 RepID=UPI00191F0D7B|nr:hypothetical protein [Microvirga zambiensis]
MSIFATFGHRAAALKRSARAFAQDARCTEIYVSDTANGAGDADYDLLYAAADLEAAARELRQMHARVEQRRADQTNPHLIAAE